MRKEFVYSFMALGAIPVVVNAADVQTINSDVLASTNGSKVTYPVGKLVKGSYTFSAKLTSKVYGVQVKIAGQTANIARANNPAEPNVVTLNFTLDAETDVELTLESTDPGEAGAGFTVADAKVILNYNFATIKTTLVNNAQTLAGTIGGYNYAAKQEDVDAANALKTQANDMDETYDNYKNLKLYATKSTIQEAIDNLAASAAAKEAAYQNEQAYNRVNAAITAIKTKYNAAVAQLEGALINQAAYLLGNAQTENTALYDLNKNINLKITEATSASYASYQAGTAVTDEAANTALVPTEEALNNIVNNWKGQATTNQNAYNALHQVVTDLQAALNAIAPNAAIASQFDTEKAEAQAAINAVNADVEAAKNSAAQLTLDVSAKETTAQNKINTLADKVTTANNEYTAWQAALTTINGLTTNLNAAKAIVNAKVSADEQYKAQDYYAAYITTVEGEIAAFTTAANTAYNTNHNAVAYNNGLDVSATQAKIDAYKTNAVLAVDNYDDLQTAMAGYKAALDAARAQVEGLAVYTDPNYDYETEFDLINKRINDIKKAITAAQAKVGVEHWTAMLNINADAAITNDIASLLDQVQSDQNQYDADFLANGMTELSGKITAFQAKDVSKLGADVATYQAIETGIEDAYNAVVAAKNAINPNSETVDYTAKVGAEAANWSVASGNNYNRAKLGNGQVEHYENSGSPVGDMIWQEVSVENGTYDIEVYATSHNANGVASLDNPANDVAYVFGKSGNNEVKTWITVRKDNGFVAGEPETYTIKGVKVENGKLTIGLHNNVAGKTNWHTIQIKSLTANTASLIQGWGAKIADLNAKQTNLETLADEIAAKVTANGTAKTQNQTNIDNLQTAMGTFETTYKIGQDDSPLGNRGKAGGSVTTEVEDINTALTTLEGQNDAVDVTAVAQVDKNVSDYKDKGKWSFVDSNTSNSKTTSVGGVTLVEHYQESGSATGTLISQKISVENGIYDVEVYATARNAWDKAALSGDANDVAHVFANNVTKQITAQKKNNWDGESEAPSYIIEKVVVSDGELNVGLAVDRAGQTNWLTLQFKSLKYHENTVAALAEYNTQYLALNDRKTALDTQAPTIKQEVADNKATFTAATTAVTNLQTAELNTLKSLKNVTNASAESDDATALKTDPANFKVFETGLAADKSYTAKKAAIDADIQAMSDAIAASNAEETLTSKWQNNSITVVTGQDPQTQADITKTYSISAITAAINALKDEAAAESDNWEAYKALQDNNMTKLLPDTITMDATVAGAGALAYYQGLKDSYITGKANILTAMKASLNARKAVAEKSTFEQEIAALIAKVKVVKSDAEANLKKYNEQKAAYTETQTLWNQTYTEIAATDHSSKVQDYLDELDAIQVTLTAATEAVEANYPLGKSVAEAKDFAAIKASINDVKASQAASYNEFVAADNLAAHESFNTAIQSATAAYQRAVQERAQYSSTNAAIKDAVDAAAATLDAALYSCPDDIQALTTNENTAYEATVSPAIFDVDQYNADALTIEQNITAALDQFKADVTTAIQGFWTGANYKPAYTAKVTAAENAIAAYSDAAKTDAFKDVKDLIAAGDAAVTAMKLTDVEATIDALAGIDAMLAADKDAAAEKDLTPRITLADSKYTEVKTYINGVTNDIAAKAEELENLETAYEEVTDAKLLAKTFANRDAIKDILDDFVADANAFKGNVETAVNNDNANTAAYNDMVEAIVPVEAKLTEAKAKAAQYKYATSFATQETQLNTLKTNANAYKNAGSAVANKATFLANVAALDGDINDQLTAAFGAEKGGLATDITELKNQYNAYVAVNGLNEQATAFKTAIDDLNDQLGSAAIADLDDPADGIQYDEILAATDALIKLQNDIADKETELLAANASGANAAVLADFNSQIAELEETASLEGYDAWVGTQAYGNTTLDAAITDLKAQIADLKAAINAEANISFYKDQYQAQIDAIEADLTPVAAQIAAKDAQFKANAAAYTALSAQIEELQGKIDAAKEKVGAYEYAAANYLATYIESYTGNPAVLSGGAQYQLNQAKAAIEANNGNKALDGNSAVANKANIETAVQNFLDDSANAELDAQINNLYTLLAYAIDAKYQEQKYSSALWNRLNTEKTGIATEIIDLQEAIDYSYVTGYQDANNQWVVKAKTSDADYAAQIATVNAIKAEIADLADAVDNLALLGDANVDGKVNVLDYQKVLNMILDPALQPADDTDLFVNIDINKSTVIEVGDLTAIVNYILNGDWQGYAAALAPARGMNATEGESMAMNMSSLENGKHRIAVSLANISSYTAFQMDVVLPDGMKIVGTELSDRAGKSHKLYSRAQMDGSIRLLASSVKGETFSGNEGAVLYIDVEGAGSVELVNILFSDVNANTHAFTIGGNKTGIDTASTFESLKQKVYDLSGRVKNSLKKGINIIRRADGTTEKVVK